MNSMIVMTYSDWQVSTNQRSDATSSFATYYSLLLDKQRSIERQWHNIQGYTKCIYTHFAQITCNKNMTGWSRRVCRLVLIVQPQNYKTCTNDITHIPNLIKIHLLVFELKHAYVHREYVTIPILVCSLYIVHKTHNQETKTKSSATVLFLTSCVLSVCIL
jgi:hypothetical protein